MESGIKFLNGIRSSLLTWYETEARELPWRVKPGSGEDRHPDPYAALVSEIMLQQTTVQTVIPYFNRWMDRYPSLKDLAVASEEEVLRMWEGLGYYNRARNLHRAARETMARYGGMLPDDALKLRGLPGIGDYTSGAVASIAYGKREPAVDANIFRVLSRLLAVTRDPGHKKFSTHPSVHRYLSRAAKKLIPPDRPGDFNQALMDLGSAICRPTAPLCGQCPLVQWCRAFNLGLTEDIPGRGRTTPIQFLEAALGIIQQKDRILVQRRPPEGLFAGMWEFPGGKLRMGVRAKGRKGERGEQTDAETRGHGEGERGRGGALRQARRHGDTETAEEAVVREVREETGLGIQVDEKLGDFTHSYTRFRVKLHVFLCKRKAGKLTNPDAKWVTLEELEDLPMPSANRRIVRALEAHLKSVGKGERA